MNHPLKDREIVERLRTNSKMQPLGIGSSSSEMSQALGVPCIGSAAADCIERLIEKSDTFELHLGEMEMGFRDLEMENRDLKAENEKLREALAMAVDLFEMDCTPNEFDAWTWLQNANAALSVSGEGNKEETS